MSLDMDDDPLYDDIEAFFDERDDDEDDDPVVSTSPRLSSTRTVPDSPPREIRHDTKQTRCKYCLKDGLYWEKSPEGKWRLFEADLDIPHTCSSYARLHAAHVQLSAGVPDGIPGDLYWTLSFYEPDEDPATVPPFAKRKADDFATCEHWLKYAKSLGAKVRVQLTLECIIPAGS